VLIELLHGQLVAIGRRRAEPAFLRVVRVDVMKQQVDAGAAAGRGGPRASTAGSG
jgi:hypothetical protein